MDRLSGDFNRGYTKAIMDLMEVFKYVNDDLNYNRIRMNYKWVEKILKCCLDNRENLRENRNGFIRIEMSETGKRDCVKWYTMKGGGTDD